MSGISGAGGTGAGTGGSSSPVSASSDDGVRVIMYLTPHPSPRMIFLSSRPASLVKCHPSGVMGRCAISWCFMCLAMTRGMELYIEPNNTNYEFEERVMRRQCRMTKAT